MVAVPAVLHTFSATRAFHDPAVPGRAGRRAIAQGGFVSIARIETEDRGLKRSRTRVLGHVAFWTAATLIVVMGWTLYGATAGARKNGLDVDQPLEALQHIGAVDESLSRTESAQRAFLIVADERYIAERGYFIARPMEAVEFIGWARGMPS